MGENRGATGRCPGRGAVAPRKERKKTDNAREGWEDGTPPPHRDLGGISSLVGDIDFGAVCVVRRGTVGVAPPKG